MQATLENTQEELLDFEEVVPRYWQSIHRFIRASVRDADVAQALTQDCFMRAYSNRDSFRGQASVKTWLIKIAVNLVHDYERNRRLCFWRRLNAFNDSPDDVKDHLPAVAVSPEEQASLNEQVQLMWKTSRRLPDKQRTVFLLRFVEDMDLSEIAAATGMKEGTVKVHLFRALHTIRERMGRFR
jgi:RNA polymerase sigma-70 factor, ECF subfamily